MEEEFVIWNPQLGISDFVTIGETDEENINAWLEEPYDMVGPFSLNELRTNGKIAFAACFVMSKQRWKEEYVFLKKGAYKMQRENKVFDETHHRQVLSLPLNGGLEKNQIKTAYRQMIKTVHPDVGGSHEEFIQVTQARDALLIKWN